jgi:hypothetical protein
MAMHASWTGWQFFLSPAATSQGQDVVWHLLLSAGIWAVALIAVLRAPVIGREALAPRPVGAR